MSEDNGHHGDRVIEDIRSLVVPGGWERTSIGEVGDVRLGRQRSPKNRSADFPTKYVRAANITWTGLDLSDVLDMDFRPAERANYRLQPGDVVLSEASGSAGEVGKSAIWNGELEECCFQNTVIRFRPKAVSSKFALVTFQHFARNSVFAQVSKGVGIHHLSADRFASMPFLLPPLKEQDRIVAKIEELFSDLDAGVAALKRAKANLKRYRAAVLKAAVEGKLTEHWRAKHPNTEPASKLLERILVERRKKWEADQLAKFAAAKKEPPKNWREKRLEPSPPDMSGLPELPEGWCWTSVEQTSDVQGGIQKQPKRAPRKNCFPFLRVANVYRNHLDLEEVHQIELFGDELKRLRLQTGDLLVVEGNGSKTEIGRSAIWNGEVENCVHQNHIIRVRFLGGSSRYLNAYWNSPSGNGRVMEQAASTSGLYTLSVTKVCALPIPLPPLVEQQEIITEVEERLSVIAAAEREIEHSLLRAARLRQSILRQAFGGKLVPQDPQDEPASALLARIAARSCATEPTSIASTDASRSRRTESELRRTRHQRHHGTQQHKKMDNKNGRAS
jgi:type I restriction enzyme S subunit